MVRTIFTLALLVVTMSVTAPAWAGPAIDFTGTVIAGNEGSSPGGVRGWVFDVLPSAGIAISHLGVYDRDADGLGEAHDVGIWNSIGTLVATGTVPAGIAAPLDSNDLFRLVDIVDVNLPQAGNYVIGAYYSNLVDGFDSQVSGLTTHPSISYTGKLFLLNVAGLQQPTTSAGQQPGYFGPSFEVVPEPSTLALAALGLLGIALRRRSKA